MTKKKQEQKVKPYKVDADSHSFWVDITLYDGKVKNNAKMYFKGKLVNGIKAFIGTIKDVDIIIPFSRQTHEDFIIPPFMIENSKSNIADAVNEYLDNKNGYA